MRTEARGQETALVEFSEDIAVRCAISEGQSVRKIELQEVMPTKILSMSPCVIKMTQLREGSQGLEMTLGLKNGLAILAGLQLTDSR